MLSQREVEIIKRAREVEKYQNAWSWYDVMASPQEIMKLVRKGIVEVVYKSNRYTLYRLREVPEVEERTEIPNDLFSVVVGYDDIKEIIMRSLRAYKPVHILLVGPPASGKSVILRELARIPGAVIVTAGSSSKAGIRDVLMEYRPRILIIDEMDKINSPKDLSILLTLMEDGELNVSLHKMRVQERMKVWVFGACNDLKAIPRELKSRFMIFRLREYTREEFMEVARKVLVEREGISEDLAEYIAERISRISRDVRDAIRVGRIARDKKDVDKVLETMRKYS